MKPDVAVAPNEPNDEHLSKACRVLIIDHSESDAFLLSQLLSLMGHTVAIAHDGRDALKQVNTFAPQMIIADISTLEIDGDELAKRVQARSDRRRILLAALAGGEQETNGDGLVELGFDAYLTKPVEITVLQNLFEILASRS
jgi:CheY-like chemotaxis protein